MSKVPVVVASVLAGFSMAIAGTPAVWKDDPAHSSVRFTVSHLVIAEVSGRFKAFDATLRQTGDDFAGASIDAVIKSESIDTDNETRDRHLRSDDFLNAAQYPEIRFSSLSVEKTGTDAYKITGNLTIRNVTKPVVLDARYNGMLKDPWGGTRIAFKATTTINRFDYGVKWDKTLDTGGLIAGKEVEITLLMEMVKQKENGGA